ncbi:hypothetical protein FG386_000839 [Cryptosporidium ryanae]|uniref:uncharacterized protein n=1 Tax=Cryptosporidium ryanae TaxID=515981 RepID=UPI00351A438A|nr:hypothetical protein FG386_000839 [Cryptosporidium ryanae]
MENRIQHAILLLRFLINLILFILLTVGNQIEVLSKLDVPEQSVSTLGSTLLLLYDVDNVILKHSKPGRTLINPDILPLLASFDLLHKLNDTRILLPRIFSHGCGTAIKLSEIKSIKPLILSSNKIFNNYDNIHPFSINIKDVGDAYLFDGVYFIKKAHSKEVVYYPLDILRTFFTDKYELESNMPSIIPFNRIIERKSIYFDFIYSNLTSLEASIFRNHIQNAKRTKDNHFSFNESPLKEMNEYQKKTYLKKLFIKISTFPKVWPLELRSKELPFIKDLVKYRKYIRKNIQIGTTIILLDDLAEHFNFGCTHEHFNDENMVFIVMIKKFVPNGNLESLTREFQRSIPVPIGTVPYVPFDLREVHNKMSKILDKFPRETHPKLFYREVRDEFIKGSPTYPKCGYDVSKPSPFHFLIVLECDILYNLIALFIDDKMNEEVVFLLNISSFIAVLPNKKSCEHVFAMVKLLISSGFYQWANKILPLPNIRTTVSNNSGGDFSPSFTYILNKEDSAQNRNLSNYDKHVFMAKLYSRIPRSKTIVLRLDFHGDPSRAQYSEYTCFLNAPPNLNGNSKLYTKSNRFRQQLGSQSDIRITRFLELKLDGEIKTTTILQKLVSAFKDIEDILNSARETYNNAEINKGTNIGVNNEEQLSEDEGRNLVEDENLSIYSANHQRNPTLGESFLFQSTTYPKATYPFLSIFYTLVETLRKEFQKDYIFCTGQE